MKTERTYPSAGERQRPAMLPWLALLFVGCAALGAWFLIGPALGDTPYYRVGHNRTTFWYSRPILLLFVPYGLALFAWQRGARAPLWALVGGAVILHLLVLLAPPPQSQDVYQYLFYGRMQAVHGANPYVVNPSELWADPWFPWIRWNNQPSVYGPVWILVSTAVVKVAGSSLPLAYALQKLVVLALDGAVVVMILSLARHRPDPAAAGGWGLLVYAWNPLILITVPLAGSADVAVGAAFLGALLARRHGRNGLATTLLALAGLVKLYAAIGLVLHLVLLARKRGAGLAFKHASASAAIVAFAYAPFWAGWETFRGLIRAASLTSQSLVGTIERVVVTPVLRAFGYGGAPRDGEILVRLIAGALLLAVLAWAVRKVRDEQTLWEATLGVLVAYVLLTPWFLYWYLVGPLLLVAVLPRNRLTYPILTFSATSLITAWLLPPWLGWSMLALLRYGPPLLVYALQARTGHEAQADRVEVRIPALPLPEGAALTRQAAAK
ncbi:MAG: glycosyltransferase 87 family protein [Actinomycetota bacterium]